MHTAAIGEADFETIGFAELLEQGGVVIVEWPARIEKLLPIHRTNVTITVTSESAQQLEIARI